MKILGKVIHGSKLYGLDSPSSDTDYKGIFLSPLEELILMRAAKNETYKVKEDNAEYENFCLQKFLQLCANGEDCVIAMLHAPKDKVLVDSEIYQYLRENRAKFYSKRLIGMAGYAKSMCIKYSLRADRMHDIERVIHALKMAQIAGVARIGQMWGSLPEGKYIEKGIEETNRTADKRYYSVCGKKVTPQVAVNYALEIFQTTHDKYGDRVKIAKSLGNADYKAISHSFRVGFQLKSIYLNGGFEYPLVETEFIKKVKYGELNYLDNNLDVRLNELITEVEELSKNSSYPEKVDQKWLDSLVLSQYGVDQKS